MARVILWVLAIRRCQNRQEVLDQRLARLLLPVLGRLEASSCLLTAKVVVRLLSDLVVLLGGLCLDRYNIGQVVLRIHHQFRHSCNLFPLRRVAAFRQDLCVARQWQVILVPYSRGQAIEARELGALQVILRVLFEVGCHLGRTDFYVWLVHQPSALVDSMRRR